jgi:hypothetical protein
VTATTIATPPGAGRGRHTLRCSAQVARAAATAAAAAQGGAAAMVRTSPAKVRAARNTPGREDLSESFFVSALPAGARDPGEVFFFPIT